MSNIKKIFAILFAVMAVMLMNTAVFAEVTGSGTKDDPFIVTTYRELQSTVEQYGGNKYYASDVYIKLANDITNNENSGTISSGGTSVSVYNYIIKSHSNTTYIDLAGKTLTVNATCADEYGMFLIFGGTLVIDDSIGTGKIVDNGILTSSNVRSMFYEINASSRDTKLVINGGTFISDTGNRIIKHNQNNTNTSSCEINGGTISTQADYAIYTQLPDYMDIKICNINGTIYAGDIAKIINSDSIIMIDGEVKDITTLTSSTISGNIVIAESHKTVTFNVGDYPFTPEQIIVSYNDTVNEPELPDDFNGKYVSGWYTDSNFENAFSFDTAITDNITLYAKWTDIKSTVSVADCTYTVYYGATVTVKGNPSRTWEWLATVDGKTIITNTLVNYKCVIAAKTVAAGKTAVVASYDGRNYCKTNLKYVYKQGDIDGDGDIDSTDAAKLLKHISEAAVITDNDVLKRADMDYNGEVDMLDVIAILNKTA